jgi:cell division protein FtsW
MQPIYQQRALALLLCASAILVLTGCIFIYSSSSIFALENHGYAHYFVYRQLLGTAVGIIFMSIIAHIPLPWLYRLTPWVFACSLIIMCVPFILPSHARIINGSARWITIMGQSLQPIEFTRISFIGMLAYIMSKKTFSYQSFWRNITAIGTITIPLVILLLMQPDFGQAFLCTLTALLMLAIVHKDLKNMSILLSSAVAGASLLIIMKPYRLRRLLTFLHPWNDPQGAGFQIIQSLIAIGSGGILGVGIGQSRQKFFYLPMQHTDFIFSIIAEETGLLGPTFIIFLYALIAYCGMYLAWHASNSFSQLALFGCTTCLSLQAIINLAVTTGLAPTKGIGLPFVSYGMSSLIAHGCMLGIIISCVRNTQLFPIHD